MYKVITLSVISLLLAILFSGCVKTGVVPSQYAKGHANQASWGDMTNIDDVDMTDYDENLSESELMMTEEGEDSRMERITFPTDEYYRLARSGKGTVSGSIYVNGTYDNRVPGANTRLYLNPVTSYSKQWYHESYLGGYKMQKADSRLFNYLRFTAADSNGKFAFYGVPSGSYYLIGTVSCGSECGYASEKSIRLAAKVTIRGNQIVRKDLTRMGN